VHFTEVGKEPRSKSCPFPHFIRHELELAAAIQRTAAGVFGAAGVPLPCVRLALCASGFHDNAVRDSAAITSFFQRGATPFAGPSQAAREDADEFPTKKDFYDQLPGLPKVIDRGHTAAQRRGTLLHYFQPDDEARDSKRPRLCGDDGPAVANCHYVCPTCQKHIPEVRCGHLQTWRVRWLALSLTSERQHNLLLTRALT